MNKIKVIDFELKKYEKDLVDMVDTIGLDEFEETEFEMSLTPEEKDLLIKCIKITIDILEGLKSDKKIFEDAYFNQLDLLENINDSIHYNTDILLTPSKHEWPLLSIEIGGRVNQDSKLLENNSNDLWTDKEYNLLVKMYEKFLSKFKIIVKIIRPYDVPKYLRD